MQHVPAFAVVAIAVEVLVTGNAPNVGGNAVLFFENLLRLEHLIHDGPAAKQLGAQRRVLFPRRLVAVQALQNALPDALAFGHGRHGQRLVGDGEVIEDRLLVDVHPLDAILENDGNLVGKRRIVGEDIRYRQRNHVAVTVLVLQALAG